MIRAMPFFLCIRCFPRCLRAGRQMDFSHKAKGNIRFLKTPAAYFFRPVYRESPSPEEDGEGRTDFQYKMFWAFDAPGASALQGLYQLIRRTPNEADQADEQAGGNGQKPCDCQRENRNTGAQRRADALPGPLLGAVGRRGFILLHTHKSSPHCLKNDRNPP